MKEQLITPKQISDISEKLEKPVSLAHSMEFGLLCYEEGVKEVLTYIASARHEQCNYDEVLTEEMKQRKDETDEAYKRLYNSVRSAKGKNLLVQYAALFTDVWLQERKALYIAGFIEGYKFLKHNTLFNQI